MSYSNNLNTDKNISFIERIIKEIKNWKNHPAIAIILILGAFIIYLAQFTDSIDKLASLTKKYFLTDIQSETPKTNNDDSQRKTPAQVITVEAALAALAALKDDNHLPYDLIDFHIIFANKLTLAQENAVKKHLTGRIVVWEGEIGWINESHDKTLRMFMTDRVPADKTDRIISSYVSAFFDFGPEHKEILFLLKPGHLFLLKPGQRIRVSGVLTNALYPYPDVEVSKILKVWD